LGFETPVAMIKDVATLGGELTDKRGTYTGRKLEELSDDYDNMKNKLTE